jgi:hypothetical protein
MSAVTEEQLREGLEAIYARGLEPAPFTVDDVVAGGTRRVRRRRAALGTAVAAVAAGALALVVGSPLTAERAAPAGGGGPGLTGCAPRPQNCVDVIRVWADSTLGLSVPDSARFVRGTVQGAHGAGRVKAWVLDTPLEGRATNGQRLALRVVLAPAEVNDSREPKGIQPQLGGTYHDVRMRLGEPGFTSLAGPVGGESRFSSWTVPATKKHEAVSVRVNSLNPGGIATFPDNLHDGTIAELFWWTSP